MFVIVLPSDTPLRPNRWKQSQAARLLVLGNMGLAQKTSPHSWQVRQDFEAVLRAMQRVNDHQRTIAAHGALLSDERLPFVRLDLRTMKSVEGRVLVHGEEESGANIGGSYLLLEGTDARVHYVPYTPEIEDARGWGQLGANPFVRLRRLFVEGKRLLEVEDFGSADKVLNNKRHLRESARYSQRAQTPHANTKRGVIGIGVLASNAECEDQSSNAVQTRWPPSFPRGRGAVWMYSTTDQPFCRGRTP